MIHPHAPAAAFPAPLSAAANEDGAVVAEASPRPVLVAISFSAQSSAVLQIAERLAAMSGAPLLIAHVVHEAVGVGGSYREHDGSSLMRPLRDVAGEMLDDFVERMRAADPYSTVLREAKTLLVEGLPAPTIRQLSEREDAALIVVGCDRQTAFRRLWNGSVADEVNRTCSCPVVIFRGAKEQAAGERVAAAS